MSFSNIAANANIFIKIQIKKIYNLKLIVILINILSISLLNVKIGLFT